MLDDRKSAILRAVVQTYIETAQPVGSSHVVAATAVGVSPATVRSDMTVLEREGYLVQPHTSAGRVPTEKGYRYFVDTIGPGELSTEHARTVRAFFAKAHGELEEMLRSTSKVLSQVTSTTAVVIAEPQETTTIRSVQLVDLSPTLYLIVVVLSSGEIVKKSVDHAQEISADDLGWASRALAGHLVGCQVGSVTAPPPGGEPAVDAVVLEAAEVLRTALGDARSNVFVEGTSLIAGAFDLTSTLHDVLGLLEQQLTIVTLLRDVMDRGLTVAIGSETGEASLADCSLVIAPYRVAGETAGTIGVLGPTRMNYSETVAAVAAVSERLGKLLSEGS